MVGKICKRGRFEPRVKERVSYGRWVVSWHEWELPLPHTVLPSEQVSIFVTPLLWLNDVDDVDDVYAQRTGCGPRTCWYGGVFNHGSKLQHATAEGDITITRAGRSGHAPLENVKKSSLKWSKRETLNRQCVEHHLDWSVWYYLHVFYRIQWTT